MLVQIFLKFRVISQIWK